MTRSVLLLAHTGRDDIADAARHATHRLQDAGVEVRALAQEAADIGLTGIQHCDDGPGSAAGAEVQRPITDGGGSVQIGSIHRQHPVQAVGPHHQRGVVGVGDPDPDPLTRAGGDVEVADAAVDRTGATVGVGQGRDIDFGAGRSRWGDDEGTEQTAGDLCV